VKAIVCERGVIEPVDQEGIAAIVGKSSQSGKPKAESGKPKAESGWQRAEGR